MGDRTWVHVYVPNELADKARAILPENDNEEDTGQLFYFEFDECNYGNLSCEQALQSAGIAYDKVWGSGDEYGPGASYCRYTDSGEVVVLDVYAADRNPPLDELLPLVNTHEALRDYIIQYSRNVTPLPWDNQVKNGKTYQMRQLIVPT